MTERETDTLVETLAAIPRRLEALAQQASETTAGVAGDEAWTPSEIVGHLCDSARYWGARMFRVAHEVNPRLASFDENILVDLAAYRYRALDELLRGFRLLAEGNVSLLRSLDAAAWDRAGTHETRGSLTLREIVAIEAGHEQVHVGQLAEALGIGKSGG
ncbi:MAG TPA: DinB family protein [Ktedonobacterales bacterium]|nr:DinB family protein [Ktedonobacterales bacterium]